MNGSKETYHSCHKQENEAIRFSIIMPCYNSSAYVCGAVESILKQTYPDWELVAINDGSTDDTLNILTAFSQNDGRIKVFSKENGGYVSAVNFGLEKITGDYFLLLGSDDRLTENLFSALHDSVEREYPDCIAFRTLNVRNGTVTGIDSFTNFHDSVFCANTCLAEYMDAYPKHAEIFTVRDTSKCYKRSILNGLRYFGQYGIDADGIFSVLLCHNATSFMSLPVDGYLWTLRSDSLSAKRPTFAQRCDCLRNWIMFFECLQKIPVQEITSDEKLRFLHFIDNISALWKFSKPFYAHYRLVCDAIHCAKETEGKLGLPLQLNAKRKFLMQFPLLWKIVWKAYGYFRPDPQEDEYI